MIYLKYQPEIARSRSLVSVVNPARTKVWSCLVTNRTPIARKSFIYYNTSQATRRHPWPPEDCQRSFQNSHDKNLASKACWTRQAIAAPILFTRIVLHLRGIEKISAWRGGKIEWSCAMWAHGNASRALRNLCHWWIQPWHKPDATLTDPPAPSPKRKAMGKQTVSALTDKMQPDVPTLGLFPSPRSLDSPQSSSTPVLSLPTPRLFPTATTLARSVHTLSPLLLFLTPFPISLSISS